MSGPTPCWSTKQICIKIHVPSLSCPSTGISSFTVEHSLGFTGENHLNYIYIYIYNSKNSRVSFYGHLLATLSFMPHARQSSGYHQSPDDCLA